MLTRGYLAIVYVSSSKEAVLGPLLSLSRSLRDTRGTVLAHSFRDEHYNRTSFFLVDTDGANLAYSAAQLYESAASSLNFRDHKGSHPTLGVCDHVTFCPLRSDSVETNERKENDDTSGLISTSRIAKDFMTKISPMSTVFGYGGASKSDISLATIRRQLGYFNQVTDAAGDCVYDPEDLETRVRECVSHAGQEDEKSFSFYEESLRVLNGDVGVTCVGAIPYIMNFNVKFDEASDVRQIKKITKAVRRLDSVEALTLKQGNAHEVACNLKNPSAMGPDSVLRVCEEQAGELALRITNSYATGPTERGLVEVLEKCGRLA